MSIETPASTVFLTLIALAALITAVVFLATAATTFFIRNRRVRVAQHEPVRAYYGRVLLGH